MLEDKIFAFIAVSIGLLMLFAIVSANVEQHRVTELQKEALARGYATYIDGRFEWKDRAK